MQKRLLYLTDARWEGGSSLSIITHRFVTGLRQKGWEVRVCAPTTVEQGAGKEEIYTVSPPGQFGLISRLGWNLKKSLSPFGLAWWWASAGKPLLLEAVQGFQPVGILAEGIASSYLAYQCYKILHIPYVVNQRDAWTVNPYLLKAYPLSKRWKKELKNWLGRRIERRILQDARFIFPLAEQLREPYVRAFHLPPEKTEIIYNAWNPEEWVPVKPLKKISQIHFLFGGSLPPICFGNLRNFLTSLQSLPQMHREVQFSFCLTGWAQETQRYIQALSLTYPISFSQGLTLREFHQRVGEADICFSVRSESPYDYGSNRVFSYMLYRKPTLVIAHPHSTEAQLVKQTRLGWVIHPNDREEMKRVLLEIHNKWITHKPLIEPDEEEIQKLSLPAQMEKLSHILERLFFPSSIFGEAPSEMKK